MLIGHRNNCVYLVTTHAIYGAEWPNMSVPEVWNQDCYLFKMLVHHVEYLSAVAQDGITSSYLARLDNLHI